MNVGDVAKQSGKGKWRVSKKDTQKLLEEQGITSEMTSAVNAARDTLVTQSLEFLQKQLPNIPDDDPNNVTVRLSTENPLTVSVVPVRERKGINAQTGKPYHNVEHGKVIIKHAIMLPKSLAEENGIVSDIQKYCEEHFKVSSED